MDGEGAFKFVGEVELCLEAVDLVCEVKGLFPAIESTFADGGCWIFFEELAESLEPVRRAFGDLPGMEAEGG